LALVTLPRYTQLDMTGGEENALVWTEEITQIKPACPGKTNGPSRNRLGGGKAQNQENCVAVEERSVGIPRDEIFKLGWARDGLMPSKQSGEGNKETYKIGCCLPNLNDGAMAVFRRKRADYAKKTTQEHRNKKTCPGRCGRTGPKGPRGKRGGGQDFRPWDGWRK